MSEVHVESCDGFVDARIAVARMVLTDRAGPWVTEQVGRHGRTVNDVGGELGCDWHAVNDAVDRARRGSAVEA